MTVTSPATRITWWIDCLFEVMLVLQFVAAQFAKPYRYFLLVKTQEEAKRTQISESTESPHFDPVTIHNEDFEISVCLVLDYSATTSNNTLHGNTLVLGTLTVKKEEFQEEMQKSGVWAIQRNVMQAKEEKRVGVGNIHLRVTREAKVRAGEQEYLEEIEEFEFKEENIEHSVRFSEKGRRVRVRVLFGSHFPANDRFKVEVGWSQSYTSLTTKRTQTSKASSLSLTPFWNFEGILPLENHQKGYIVVLVKTNNDNIVDKASFPVSKMQPFYQYHLEVELKQTIEGVKPRVFLEMNLEALPVAFVEEVCELKVAKVLITPEPESNRRFVMAFSEQELAEIKFDRVSLEEAAPVEIGAIERLNREGFNKYFCSPIMVTPLSVSFEYFFLKSTFIRKKLRCTIFQLDRLDLTKTTRVSSNTHCLAQIKSSFYNQRPEMFSLEWKEQNRKLTLTAGIEPSKVHLYSPHEEDFKPQKSNPLANHWKDLSTQLLLKQNLIQQMRREIDSKIKNIQSKGSSIEVLRRVEQQLIERRKYLENKQAREREIQPSSSISDSKVDIPKLQRQLVSVCGEVQAVEGINQEMKVRLNSLNIESKEESIKALEESAVFNSALLQEQQEKIQEIDKIDKFLRVQSTTLLKLEKQFEKGIVDHEMNQLLNKELKNTECYEKERDTILTKTSDEYSLERILKLLSGGKEKKPTSLTGKLKQEILAAEEELKKKTQVYSKLIHH